MHSELHTPVLFEEIRDIFQSKHYNHPIVVDATLGLGGHSEIFCQTMEGGTLIGFDRDSENLNRAKSHLMPYKEENNLIFISESFSQLGVELSRHSIEEIDVILYDLGVSSVHYDDAERGFSIREDGPLDMRFDRSKGKTASDLVMKLDARELAHLFTEYGEEKKSWFIAQAIVEARKTTPIDTTQKLLEIIEASSFDKKSPIRVFQALRIAVNDEFSHIETSLGQALSHLRVGGLIFVITFHSLEDRLVKQYFAPYLEDEINDITGQITKKASFRKYSKKPIEPKEKEVQDNPRSRSAKLRILERVA